MTQNWKKCTAKKIFFIKNYNLPIPRPPERMFKLQRKPSVLKRKHAALQNMKFLNFLWIIFALLDPDLDFESGSESTV
jgi:hypothetical protein